MTGDGAGGHPAGTGILSAWATRTLGTDRTVGAACRYVQGSSALRYAAGGSYLTAHDTVRTDDFSFDAFPEALLVWALEGRLPCALPVSCSGLARIAVALAHAMQDPRWARLVHFQRASPTPKATTWLGGGTSFASGATHTVTALGDAWIDLAVRGPEYPCSFHEYNDYMAASGATPLSYVHEPSTWPSYLKGRDEALEAFLGRLPPPLAALAAEVRQRRAFAHLVAIAAFGGGNHQRRALLLYDPVEDSLHECVPRSAASLVLISSLRKRRRFGPKATMVDPSSLGNGYVLRRLGAP